VSLHPADERMLDAAMAQLWGARFLSKILINTSDPAACWHWTGARGRQGYGCFRIGNKICTASRLACELVHGSRSLAFDAMHTVCDTPSCARGTHLRWGSRAENLAEMVAKGRSLRGEACPGAKLSRGDVLQIVSLLNRGESQRLIAHRFGVREQAVNRIRRGDRWGWLTGRGSVGTNAREAS
jgi:hypothetical protein